MTRPAHLTAVPDLPCALPGLNHSSPRRSPLIENPAADAELIRVLLEDEYPRGEIDAAESHELARRRLEEREYDLILADLTAPHAEVEMVVGSLPGAVPVAPKPTGDLLPDDPGCGT